MPYGNNDGGSGEFTGAPSNILVVNDNVLQTTVTGSPTTFGTSSNYSTFTTSYRVRHKIPTCRE